MPTITNDGAPGASGTSSANTTVTHTGGTDAANANDPTEITDHSAVTSSDGVADATTVEEDVFVWANEGNPDVTGRLQPVPRRHFGERADGSLSLSGPRVNVEMPTRISVRVHEIRMTEVLESVPSPFERDPRPDAQGAFSAEATTARAGATTAFYASTQVLDFAERWAGHRVDWGEEGRLKVVPYSLVTNFFNSYYHPKSRTLALGALGTVDPNDSGIAPHTGEVPGWERPSPGLEIDGATSRDIVAHEAAHAILHAVKPGLAYGVGRAYQEGFADIMSALTALSDPDVADRVLAQTGGDLSRDNEVTEVAEEVGVVNDYIAHGHGDTSSMRSLLEDVKLSDLNTAPKDADVPGMGMVPSRSAHAVGHVFSRAAWDFLVAIYESEKAGGKSETQALAAARDHVGSVLMRSARHLPEHHLTFESVALAMVRVEKESMGGTHTPALIQAFVDRGVFEPGMDVQGKLDEAKSALPEFSLPPRIKDAHEILEHLKIYEAEALATIGNARGPHPHLLWHNPYVPSIEIVDPAELSLYSDVTDEDGWRVIRLAYETDGPSGSTDPFTAHISVVFDTDGKLADVKSHRPTFPSYV
jgi:hypothetical protein